MNIWKSVIKRNNLPDLNPISASWLDLCASHKAFLRTRVSISADGIRASLVGCVIRILWGCLEENLVNQFAWLIKFLIFFVFWSELFSLTFFLYFHDFLQLLLLRWTHRLWPDAVIGPPGLHLPQHSSTWIASRPWLQPRTMSFWQGPTYPSSVGEHPVRSEPELWNSFDLNLITSNTLILCTSQHVANEVLIFTAC